MAGAGRVVVWGQETVRLSDRLGGGPVVVVKRERDDMSGLECLSLAAEIAAMLLLGFSAGRILALFAWAAWEDEDEDEGGPEDE